MKKLSMLYLDSHIHLKMLCFREFFSGYTYNWLSFDHGVKLNFTRLYYVTYVWTSWRQQWIIFCFINTIGQINPAYYIFILPIFITLFYLSLAQRQVKELSELLFLVLLYFDLFPTYIFFFSEKLTGQIVFEDWLIYYVRVY